MCTRWSYYCRNHLSIDVPIARPVAQPKGPPTDDIAGVAPGSTELTKSDIPCGFVIAVFATVVITGPIVATSNIAYVLTATNV